MHPHAIRGRGKNFRKVIVGGGVRKFHFGGRSCIVRSGSQNFERKFKIA